MLTSFGSMFLFHINFFVHNDQKDHILMVHVDGSHTGFGLDRPWESERRTCSNGKCADCGEGAINDGFCRIDRRARAN